MRRNKKDWQIELTPEELHCAESIMHTAMGAAPIKMLLAGRILDEVGRAALADAVSKKAADCQMSNTATRRIMRYLISALREDVEISYSLPEALQAVKKLLQEGLDLCEAERKTLDQRVRRHLRDASAKMQLPGLKEACSRGYGSILLYHGPKACTDTALALALTELLAAQIPISVFMGSDRISGSIQTKNPGVQPVQNWIGAGCEKAWVLKKFQDLPYKGAVIIPEFLHLYGRNTAELPPPAKLTELVQAANEECVLLIGSVPAPGSWVETNHLLLRETSHLTQMDEKTQVLHTVFAINGQPISIGVKE